MKRHLGTFLRLGLGVVLVCSALFKAFSPGAATKMTAQFIGFSASLSVIFVFILCVAECGIGILFVMGKFIKLAAILSSTLFLASIIVGVSFSDAPIECGCFGDLFVSTTDTAFLVRGVCLLGISLLLLRWSNEPHVGERSNQYVNT